VAVRRCGIANQSAGPVTTRLHPPAGVLLISTSTGFIPHNLNAQIDNPLASLVDHAELILPPYLGMVVFLLAWFIAPLGSSALAKTQKCITY